MSLASRISDLATAIGSHIKTAVAPRLLPSGGGSGQVLAKSSVTDYVVGWIDPPAGGGGGATLGGLVPANLSSTAGATLGGTVPGDL